MRLFRVTAPAEAVMVLKTPVEATTSPALTVPEMVGLMRVGVVMGNPAFNCPVPVWQMPRTLSMIDRLLAKWDVTDTTSDWVARTKLKLVEVDAIIEVSSYIEQQRNRQRRSRLSHLRCQRG